MAELRLRNDGVVVFGTEQKTSTILGFTMVRRRYSQEMSSSSTVWGSIKDIDQRVRGKEAEKHRRKVKDQQRRKQEEKGKDASGVKMLLMVNAAVLSIR